MPTKNENMRKLNNYRQHMSDGQRTPSDITTSSLSFWPDEVKSETLWHIQSSCLHKEN